MSTFGQWTLDPVAIALVLLGAVYEAGRLRSPKRPRGGHRGGSPWLVRLAVTLGALTLLSPLGGLARDELFARSLVDFLLAYVVAPLVVLGAPWSSLAVVVGLPPDVGTARRSSGARGRLRRLAGHPGAAVGVFIAVCALWHLPVLLDASVHSEPVRAAEFACYLVAGMLLWAQLVGSAPFEPRWGALRRAGLITVALVATSIIGMDMVFSTGIWYPAFASGRGALLTAGIDQEFAGGVVWALPVIPLGIAAIWCFAEWLKRDEEDATLEQLIQRTRGDMARSGRPGAGGTYGREGRGWM